MPGELQIRALCVTDCKSVTSKREMCSFHVKRSIEQDLEVILPEPTNEMLMYSVNTIKSVQINLEQDVLLPA